LTVLGKARTGGVSLSLEGGLSLFVFLLVDLASGKPLVQDVQCAVTAIRRPDARNAQITSAIRPPQKTSITSSTYQ